MKLSRNKIRVLVVDDSLLFREVISRGISSDPRIEVVATANDPFDARDKIIEYKPDVMTCDVNMPKMDGIEFIRRLLPQYPIPVVVVSSVNGAVFDAINAGAIDFIAKPDMSSSRGIAEFIHEMIEKIKIAYVAKIRYISKERTDNKIYGSSQFNNRMIAIGASTGGTEAIGAILKALPLHTPGIVIVQHIPPSFSRMFAERLNETVGLCVKEAETGDVVKEGQVLIAPGDKHMKIIKAGGKYKVNCYAGEKVSGHCPSVDILFESVAKEVGKNAIGIILTGMGADGARGLLSMRKKGARTIGQDQKSSVVYGMPKAAYDMGAVEIQSPLNEIAQQLFKLL